MSGYRCIKIISDVTNTFNYRQLNFFISYSLYFILILFFFASHFSSKILVPVFLP